MHVVNLQCFITVHFLVMYALYDNSPSPISNLRTTTTQQSGQRLGYGYDLMSLLLIYVSITVKLSYKINDLIKSQKDS